MLILLPPSEGKSDPPDAPPVDLAELAFADRLSEHRSRLMSKLEKLADRPTAKAIEALGISAGQAGDIARDATIATAPAAPASELYSGVLYDRLDLAGLNRSAAKRAEGHVLIASALWGMLRPSDRIPYYRLSMKANLPRIAGLSAFWRPPLTKSMTEHDQPGRLILDMRSGAYATAWKPKRARRLSVRVFTEVDGSRKAVSHMAKATRGDVARVILRSPELPESAEVAATAVESSGLTVELSESFLDVIESR